ncbi:Glucose 1-dehydrogenase B [Grifola frondosa]|uniref:Glucose 1-dehydrogenase B n=1 Tax=Grifola frondosa TaxID=5627 RepID=A0A1C7MIX9_GRIFR|nr:Glucose 1-dehydrogenase B [Grifola frondosa]
MTFAFSVSFWNQLTHRSSLELSHGCSLYSWLLDLTGPGRRSSFYNQVCRLTDLLFQQNLDTLAEQLKQTSGPRTLTVLGDVSVEADVQALVDTVVREFGGLDVMVANAGIAKVATLHETSVEDLDHLYAVNVRGVFLSYKKER